MQKIIGSSLAYPLYSVASTREIEARLAKTLPPHALMARAATAAAQLAKAIAPHAKHIWVACGPGNNGGDGLLAAALLAPWLAAKGGEVSVTWCGNEKAMPTDARWALGQARAASVRFISHPPAWCDLTIDALLGLGATKRTNSPSDSGGPTPLYSLLTTFRQVSDQLLCLDIPSDLSPETGQSTVAKHSIYKSDGGIFTLTFITLKAGLFTGQGRDAAGEVWFDDLGADHSPLPMPTPVAWLNNAANLYAGRTVKVRHSSAKRAATSRRLTHATHKGDFGDVWILGGQGMSHSGHAMTGAALLAGRAALYAGAGRVFVVPLDVLQPISVDATCPELMFRRADALDTSDMSRGVWVCGCGGGQAVATYLPTLLQQAPALILDADALNAIAADHNLQQVLAPRSRLQWVTVLTPHPLEAARLLNTSTSVVQQDRLAAATALATRLNVICVLKGSGTVVAAPGLLPAINSTGNARLSTAGTGDVLAGMLGAAFAGRHAVERTQADTTHAVGPNANCALTPVFETVCQTVWQHGHIADNWPANVPLTASQLAFASTLPTTDDARFKR